MLAYSVRCGEMSGKSIDKDHIRLSLSGLATDHPHGDVNYLCFTTKKHREEQSSLCDAVKLLMQSPGYIQEFVKKK